MQSEEELLAQALAASLAEQPREDRDLAEAIRLSLQQAQQGEESHTSSSSSSSSSQRHDLGTARRAAHGGTTRDASTSRRTPPSAASSARKTRPVSPGRPLTVAEQLRERQERLKRKIEADEGTRSSFKSPKTESEVQKEGDFKQTQTATATATHRVAKQPSDSSPPSSSTSWRQPPVSALSTSYTCTPHLLGSHASSPSHPSPKAAQLRYPNGALRITRTPGRQSMKNTTCLSELIDGRALMTACVFSFFIAQDELFRYFPFSPSTRTAPIYIGRDINMDPLMGDACRRAGLPLAKPKKANLEKLQTHLEKVYQEMYGSNYRPFYPWCNGSAHTKLLALVYPNFLRIVVTSCNMMDIDTVLGDNHWYIHDLPKLSKASKDASPGFETDFLDHLKALNTPLDFVESIRGRFDYSSVRVSLVTSIPGTHAGASADKHGLLRLRTIVKDLGHKLPKLQDQGKAEVEVCMASIGKLTALWLDNFVDCALGRKRLELPKEDEDVEVPNIRIVYPTVQDVRRCHEESQRAASNIGCHTRPWDETPLAIRELFHRYASRDDRRMFHQKRVMVLNAASSSSLPYYVYIGSANLSRAAWGGLEHDGRQNAHESHMKLTGTKNFECGVVIPGHLLASLLEPGMKDWTDGVIPYVRPAPAYNLSSEKPWNAPEWAENNRIRKEEAAGR